MKLKVLVDINVLLDVLIYREPFFVSSGAIWSAAEAKKITGYVSANSITTIYYLTRKNNSKAAALKGIRAILSIFEIAPIDHAILHLATQSAINDFEDAVQSVSAKQMGAHFIVTRDNHHFTHSEIPSISPDTFVLKYL